jgi:predicted permease
MIRLGKLLRRSVFRRPAEDRELDEEIRFHLAQETARRMAGGVSRADAERAARMAFGSPALVRERTRAVWVWTALEQLLQDVRFGFRILTKSPALSVTAVVLVALVIGGNATVFSMAHGILAKPSPGVHASGLLTVSWVAEDGFIETHNGYGVFKHFSERASTFASITAYDFRRVTMMHESGSYALRAGIVAPNYFDTLGVRLVNGRGFSVDEATRGTSGLVAVISHRLWQTTFQATDRIVGQAITLNGLPATVVGVAEPGFHGAIMAELADLWLPLAGEIPAHLDQGRGTAVAMIGRLAPGQSGREAQAELSTLWSQLQAADSSLAVFGLVPQKYKVRLVPYSATAGGNSLVSMFGYRILAIFSVVTLLTVLIVCANVANLLIARAVVRQREIALRQSLGASRVRVVRGLIAEGLALSTAAWVAACLFAWWVSRAVATYLIPAVAPGPVVYPALTPDWTVIGYALALAVVCTLAVTIGPALRTWSQPLLPYLKIGEQALVGSRSKLSGALVVLQLAFSVLLLTSAGLAYRSFTVANGTDVGFDTHNLLMATVNTAGSASGPDANLALIEMLRDRLARMPQVESVSYVPYTRIYPWIDFPVRRDRSSDPVLAGNPRISPDFFRTLGVPLIAGNDFRREAGANAGHAIITRQLASTLWPGEPAIGKVFWSGPPDRLIELQVTGVVGDAYFGGRVTDNPPRFMFTALDARPEQPGETTLLIRHTGAADTVAPAVARALREADGRVPIAALRSMESQLASEQAPFWMLATLLALFAGASLLVAAIGQYAVVAFEGRRRTREFGLRIALGASAEQVVRSVLRESLRLTAIGLAIGLVLSVAVGTLMARFLYGITPTDPITYIAVFALLATTSLVACYLPARRAARVDPLVALRQE